MAVMRYLPYGIAVGIIVAVLLAVVNDRLVKCGKNPISIAAVTSFFMYAVIVVCITFLSREDGSRKGIVDLELFSTWGINDRNNAFVIENILLFIPYGFVCAWALKHARKLWSCTLYGLFTSLSIEMLQMITRRGYFQVDDILTNVAGTVLGYLLFWCIWQGKKAVINKKKKGGAKSQ